MTKSQQQISLPQYLTKGRKKIGKKKKGKIGKNYSAANKKTKELKAHAINFEKQWLRKISDIRKEG